ncbi:PIN domain-containing protein [Kamptonema cortianum]|uniref:PIN domain-containing protein n=1 Tax=Geitlerinema calcuttense NRMC-F 0142 TaxID=2922238 RepID=A0ABT7LY10_9CYAN|nr:MULTISPECIES: PIN domain-containing protein [Cyanophyceae]MDK3157490.1 PIN domain-containing protein [Kamptonema cortianum]MDL5052604.1 PIN domain-containing protein [Oscillatoria laete-virens NRMC-F 0139]MDL5056907.1 PIN domain-containing protein [Geitlerinema calcuttense NRMC-F 0142]
MTARAFVDTNILLYAVSTDAVEKPKTDKARELLQRDDLGLSVQVLQEFYVNATKLSAVRLSHAEALEFIHVWRRFPVVDMSIAIFDNALKIKAQYQISYWDAAIIAAAQSLECRELCSEDLQNGMKFGRLSVVNPFS